MGKRELLIAVAFIAVAAMAYQLTAPPAKPGQGFSFSQFFNRARRNADTASAQATSSQTVTVAATVREIRIRDVRGAVQLLGENRADIAAEFGVQSTGPDTTTATSYVKGTHLKIDSLEDAIVLRVEYPDGGRQIASLTLHVPKRLAARVDGSNGVKASAIASLQLTSTIGESTIEQIAGPVAGDYRGGTLAITDAGSVDLTLNNVRATITGVRAMTRVDARAGRCTITGALGPIELENRAAIIEIRDNHGPARVGGQGGRLDVTGAASEVRADMRRTDITVEARAAVPMSLSTTDARLELGIGSPAGTTGQAPPIQLDAVATDGEVHAADWQLTPVRSDRDWRLDHAFGGGARVSLRSQRGDIVIKKLGDVEIKKGQ